MARRHLPPLMTLRAFEAAARLENFKHAAEELNVTQSAISHQIASLERDLGGLLFDRMPGRVVLNEKGRHYFLAVKDAIDRIASATDAIRCIEPRMELTIQVYVTVAVRWLIPRLQAFKAQAPATHVSLNAGLLDWDFNPDHADVGLVYVPKAKKINVFYQPWRQERLVSVCCPAMATRMKTADDIRHATFLSIDGTQDDVSSWTHNNGWFGGMQGKILHFDSYLLAIEAAVNGQGIAIVPEFLVENDIRQQRLVMTNTHSSVQPGRWFIACLKARKDEPAIKQFSTWLVGLEK